MQESQHSPLLFLSCRLLWRLLLHCHPPVRLLCFGPLAPVVRFLLLPDGLLQRFQQSPLCMPVQTPNRRPRFGSTPVSVPLPRPFLPNPRHDPAAIAQLVQGFRGFAVGCLVGGFAEGLGFQPLDDEAEEGVPGDRGGLVQVQGQQHLPALLNVLLQEDRLAVREGERQEQPALGAKGKVNLAHDESVQ